MLYRGDVAEYSSARFLRIEHMGSAPLWTLRYEILAYIGTAIIFSLGLLKKKWMVLAQFILPSIAWVVAHGFGVFELMPGTVQNMMRFGIAYGLGATIYAYRERLSFHVLGFPLVIGLAMLTSKLQIFEVTMNIMLAYFVMWAAYIKAPKLNFLQKLSDVSYGLYIYHWSTASCIISDNVGCGKTVSINSCSVVSSFWAIV